MFQLDPNGTQQENSQQNWSSTFSEQGRTNNKGTKGQTQTGPAFQDLMSGWIQPESDNESVGVH